MASNSKNVAPPAYELLGPSEAASQIFFDRIQSTVNAECGNTNAEPLRPSACVTSCSIVLQSTTAGLAPLLSLLRTARTSWMYGMFLRQWGGFTGICISEQMSAAPSPHTFGNTCIPRVPGSGYPSRALSSWSLDTLNISTPEADTRVVSMVYPTAVGLRYWLVSSLLTEACSHLALPHQTKRDSNSLKKITEAARPCFTSIDGLNSAIVCVGSDPTTAFTEEAGCRYELTARGQHYRDNRLHTLNMVQRTIQPLLNKARACISGVLDRREVFPKNKAERLLLCDHTCMGPGPTPTGPPKESPTWAEPPRWREVESMPMTDLFEHRPAKGFAIRSIGILV